MVAQISNFKKNLMNRDEIHEKNSRVYADREKNTADRVKNTVICTPRTGSNTCHNKEDSRVPEGMTGGTCAAQGEWKTPK